MTDDLGRERRRSRRFIIQLQGTIAIVDRRGRTDSRTGTLTTKDISTHGSYLFTNRRPRVRSYAELALSWPTDGLVLPAAGEILRVEERSDKEYAMAVRFDTFPWKPAEIREAAFRYYGSLEKIKHHVEENYSLELSLDAAARVACMEATYFSAFFHAKTGVRFRDWLQQVRIGRSMDLMATKDHSVTEVAFAVGYSDLRTFERAFKKIVRVTPLQFKKIARPA